jgi:hypothetical protein
MVFASPVMITTINFIMNRGERILAMKIYTRTLMVTIFPLIIISEIEDTLAAILIVPAITITADTICLLCASFLGVIKID